MDLRQLRYFDAVAETCHFGQAAERLHLAQPALSQAIRRLEAELGVLLLARTTRQVTLTPAGEFFHREVRRILGDLDASVVGTRSIADGSRGLLRVGFTGTSAFTQLARLSRIVRSALPGVTLEVQADLLTPAQVERLLDGRLDLGVLRGPVAEPGVETRTLLREPLVLALPADHRLVPEQAPEVVDVAGDEFVAYADTRSAVTELNGQRASARCAAGACFPSAHNAGPDVEVTPRDSSGTCRPECCGCGAIQLSRRARSSAPNLGALAPSANSWAISTGESGGLFSRRLMPSTASSTRSGTRASWLRRNRSGVTTATPVGRERTGKSRVLAVTRWVASAPTAIASTCRSLSSQVICGTSGAHSVVSAHASGNARPICSRACSAARMASFSSWPRFSTATRIELRYTSSSISACHIGRNTPANAHESSMSRSPGGMSTFASSTATTLRPGVAARCVLGLLPELEGTVRGTQKSAAV